MSTNIGGITHVGCAVRLNESDGFQVQVRENQASSSDRDLALNAVKLELHPLLPSMVKNACASAPSWCAGFKHVAAAGRET